jgi:hypothetical protein
MYKKKEPFHCEFSEYPQKIYSGNGSAKKKDIAFFEKNVYLK